jgi:hypothetical protein
VAVVDALSFFTSRNASHQVPRPTLTPALKAIISRDRLALSNSNTFRRGAKKVGKKK